MTPSHTPPADTARVEELPEGHAALETDHKHIWLSARCEDERTWCQDDQGGCDECGEPSVKYVRADIADSLCARVMELEAVLRAVRQRARNARGAIESNQVVDKDVHGSMNWMLETIDASLQSSPKE